MKTTHLKLGLLASAIAVCGTLMSVSAPVKSKALTIGFYSANCESIQVNCVVQPTGEICKIAGVTIYSSTPCLSTLKKPTGGEASH